jgi:hypothetical protein
VMTAISQYRKLSSGDTASGPLTAPQNQNCRPDSLKPGLKRYVQ